VGAHWVPAIGHLLSLDMLAFGLDQSFVLADHHVVSLERVERLPMDIRTKADRMARRDLDSCAVRDCQMESTRQVTDTCLPLAHMSELWTWLMAQADVHRACCRMALEDTLTMALERAAMMDGQGKNLGDSFGMHWDCVAEKAIDRVLRFAATLMACPVASHARPGMCFLVADLRDL
jgi:hypothetical protein